MGRIASHLAHSELSTQAARPPTHHGRCVQLLLLAGSNRLRQHKREPSSEASNGHKDNLLPGEAVSEIHPL